MSQGLGVLRFAAAACIATTVSLAQGTAVVPAPLAGAPGNSSTSLPFGRATAVRLQLLYAANETGLTGAVTVRSVAVRAEEGMAQPAKAAIDVQLELSTTVADPAMPNTVFAQNRGANHAIAFVRKQVSLPAAPAQRAVGAWAALPLDTPFAYDPTTGNLLLEYDVAAQPPGAFVLDAAAGDAGHHATIGAGCGGFVGDSSGGTVGKSVAWTMRGGPPSAAAVFVFGTGLLPMPFAVPGSPGCEVHVNPLLTLPAATSATGGGSVTVPLPAAAVLRGYRLEGQWAAVDASSQQVRTTNAREVHLGSPYALSRVYSPDSDQAVSGTVQIGAANVVSLGL